MEPSGRQKYESGSYLPTRSSGSSAPSGCDFNDQQVELRESRRSTEIGDELSSQATTRAQFSLPHQPCATRRGVQPPGASHAASSG